MVKVITSNDLRPRQTEVAHAVMDGARWLVTTHGRPTFAIVSVADLKLLEAIGGRELDLRRPAVRELQSRELQSRELQSS
jgi:prevent-host-death family protein